MDIGCDRVNSPKNDQIAFGDFIRMRGRRFPHHGSPSCVFRRGAARSVETRGSESMEKRMPRIPLDESHASGIRVWQNGLRAITVDDLSPLLYHPAERFLPRD